MSVSGVSEPVEFVINCFERNIEEVTRPGFLAAAIGQHRHAFALRTLLVNNVDDRHAAARRADACVERGEVDRWFFVENRLEDALKATGLRRSDFGRYLHWSDCCVVALDLDGPSLLCYVDVDLRLGGEGDWVAQAVRRMANDPRIAVANPSWRIGDMDTSVAKEADEVGDGWALGYGFSDQIFLCRRKTFRRRLIPRWVPLALASPASARYLGYQSPGRSTLFFEQVADSYMRRKRLMRLTLTDREFEPIPMTEYPVQGVIERISSRASRKVLAITRWGRARYGWTDPRVRTTGLLDPDFQSARLKK